MDKEELKKAQAKLWAEAYVGQLYRSDGWQPDAVADYAVREFTRRFAPETIDEHGYPIELGHGYPIELGHGYPIELGHGYPIELGLNHETPPIS